MVDTAVRPQTPEERLIWWAILSTWGLWLVGALYHVLPMLAWVLGCLGLLRWQSRGSGRLAPGVLVWASAAVLLLVALVVGHVDWDLGPTQLVKSIAGWGKGWALFAVLPLAGAMLVVRPAVVVRATAILGAQSIVVGGLMILAAFAGAPAILYVSPLVVAGGGDYLFFQVGPYLPDPGMFGFRLRFFAPWSPAAALAGVMIAALSAFDRDWRWSATGIAAGAIMCLLAQSRLGLVALALLAVLVPMLANVTRPVVAASLALVAIFAAIGSDTIALAAEELNEAFVAARADSSRVRSALQNIAWHRWLADAPIWGHGIVERGPHLVEFMPIGSHHTWYSLLFVKGLVGCAAFAGAILWTLAEAVAKAQRDRTARMALAVALMLAIFSFGENLEILAYLVWPALLTVGMAMRRRLIRAPAVQTW